MKTTGELPADPIMVDITKPGNGWYYVVAHYPFDSHVWSVMRSMPDCGPEHIYTSADSADVIAVCAALNASEANGPRAVACDVREWLDTRKAEKEQEQHAPSQPGDGEGAR